MTRQKKRSEPTGIELFLYWWEHTGRESMPQKYYQLALYDEEFRKWLNGWKPRQTFFNVCRQAARRSVGSLITSTSLVQVRSNGGLTLDPIGTALVKAWLEKLPRNDRTPVATPPVVKHTEEYHELRTVHTPHGVHPIGTNEMIGVVSENYGRNKSVASYTEGFRDGAEWVLSMDWATLKYLRGELTDD